MKTHYQNRTDWTEYDPAKTRRDVEDAIEQSKEYNRKSDARGRFPFDKVREGSNCNPTMPNHHSGRHSCC